MKAIVKGDWFYDYENNSYIIKNGDKVKVYSEFRTDSDVFDGRRDACYLCEKYGVSGYIPLSNLTITDYTKDIDWEQRRYEISKAVLQGLLADSTLECDEKATAQVCIKYADELIKQLKEETK